jgi:hypothetical protein
MRGMEGERVMLRLDVLLIIYAILKCTVPNLFHFMICSNLRYRLDFVVESLFHLHSI